MSAIRHWFINGMPGFDYVIVGYWVVGSFLGLYLGICAGMDRNPVDFEESLTQRMPDSDSALYLRIGLGVVCLITLFVPGTSFLLGIAGHVGWLFTAHNPTSQEIIGVIFGGMLLIGFVGFFVISSGIIPLQPE